MSSKVFINITFLLLSVSFFSACSDSKNKSQEGAKAQEAYIKAEQNLRNTGASFSKANKGRSIVLSFDALNKKIKESNSATEKLSYLNATLSAMSDFNSKALELLNTSSLVSESHIEVATKRSLVSQRLESVRRLISAQEKAAAVESELAARRAAHPYKVKIGSMEFNLCEINYENPDLRYNRQKVLVLKNDLKLAKMLLCLTDQDTLKNAFSEMSKFESLKIAKWIGLYTPRSQRESQKQIILPQSNDFLKGKTLTDEQGGYYSDESRTKYSINVEIPFLELLYLADKSKMDSVSFINFIGMERYGFVRGSPDLLKYLESVYDNKEEILSKFESSNIKDFLSKKFEQAILKTTGEIIRFIIAKDHESLKRFSTAENVNRISYDRHLKINSDLSAFGFSPLMVASLLGDDEAVEILLAVEGIDPNLESPVFKKTYRTIGSLSTKSIGHLQRFSGSYGSGSGRGTGEGSSFRLSNVPSKYRGYTALMIAVAEGQCDLVDTILEQEPYTLNHKTSKGKTALRVSIGSGNCLKKLLEAGAFDLSIYSGSYLLERNFKQIVEENGLESILDFIKYVDDAEFKTEEVRENVPKILLWNNLDLDFKKELLKRVPLAIAGVRSLMRNERTLKIDYSRVRTSGIFASYSYPNSVRTSIDFEFLKEIDFNLAKEKAFGDINNQLTFFEYIFSNINKGRGSQSAANVERALKGVLLKVYEVNPKWVTDWANSDSSFKGQNPLVAASMFNEVGMVKALLSIDGVDVSVVDAKTGYNAFEWQYVVNPFMWNFTYSTIASTLSEKGGAVRSEKSNLIGKPKRAAKGDMEKKWKNAIYPFGKDSSTTEKPE